jgi:hypothetical protein
MNTWKWAVASMSVWLGCASSQPPPPPPVQVRAPVSEAAPAEAPPTEAPPAPGCPAGTPIELSSCSQHGLRCTYAASPECGTLWECYLGQWYVRARGSCSSQFEGVCPRKAGEVPEGVQARSGVTCLYPEGLVCAYRAERTQPVCSGVARAIPPPAAPTYRCEAPGPAACALGGFQQGGACEPDGVSCGVSCCGLGAVCVRGEWQLEMRPCPP